MTHRLSEEEVEVVARAICLASGFAPDLVMTGTYPSVVGKDGGRQQVAYVGEPKWKSHEYAARAALTELKQLRAQVAK